MKYKKSQLKRISIILSILLVLTVSFVLAFAIANYGTIFGMMFLVFLITPLLIYFIVVKPEFGIMFYLTLAYTLSWLSRYLIGNFPLLCFSYMVQVYPSLQGILMENKLA